MWSLKGFELGSTEFSHADHKTASMFLHNYRVKFFLV